MGSNHQDIFWNQQQIFHWQLCCLILLDSTVLDSTSSTNLDNNRLGNSFGWISSTNMHGIYIACNYVGKCSFSDNKNLLLKSITVYFPRSFLWWHLQANRKITFPNFVRVYFYWYRFLIMKVRNYDVRVCEYYSQALRQHCKSLHGEMKSTSTTVLCV